MGCLKLTYRTDRAALKAAQGCLPKNGGTCAGAYRYGFNGMEKENAVNEDGYTSTWRQYSSWSARWKGLDPQMRKFPHESPYLAFGANPVFYVDSEGDVKITYYTQTHGDGTKTKFAKVDADYVEHKWVLTKAWGGNYETYGSYAYDVTQHKALDSKGNETSSGPEILHFRESSASYLFYKTTGMASKFAKGLDEKAGGKGGTVKGGYYFVTEDGGADPTKFIADSDAEMKDVTAFLVTAGRTGFAPSLPAVRSPNLQGLPTVANTAKEQVDGWSGEAEPPVIEADSSQSQWRLTPDDPWSDVLIGPDGGQRVIGTPDNNED
jgi:hypothetical protein